MSNANNSSGRPVAIYVHGLASGMAAQTFKTFQSMFPQFEWVSDDFGESIGLNVRQLNRMIHTYNPKVIIGTSLGGVTVLYADAPDAIKIAVNPALSIAHCARHTIGLGRHPYFCPRKDGKREFVLTENMRKSYQRYLSQHTPLPGAESYAIFAAHDELLGDDAALIAQQKVANCGYDVVIDPHGRHRIEPSTIEIISQHIAKVIDME